MSKKRNLFAEIAEGFDALADERTSKATLRTHKIEHADVPDVTAEETLALRKRLRLSRPVFAARLRTNPRTLENWELNRAKPNAQAALLIRLQRAFQTSWTGSRRSSNPSAWVVEAKI